jgi:hypothetical protein
MKRYMQRICDRYITYRQDKFKVPNGLCTHLPVPKKSWVDIFIDFILGLPRLKSGRGSIFMVVDKFSKMTHFISCHKTNDATNIADLFFMEIVWFHRVPISIISYRNVKFISYFGRFCRISWELNCYFILLVIHE